MRDHRPPSRTWERPYYHPVQRDGGSSTDSEALWKGYVLIVFFFDCPNLTWFLLGTVHELGTPEYEAKIPPSKRKPGSRSVIVINVHRVGTVSCHTTIPPHSLS